VCYSLKFCWHVRCFGSDSAQTLPKLLFGSFLLLGSFRVIALLPGFQFRHRVAKGPRNVPVEIVANRVRKSFSASFNLLV
jgi:hypothetical protein